jgi:hypothetical protein
VTDILRVEYGCFLSPRDHSLKFGQTDLFATNDVHDDGEPSVIGISSGAEDEGR